MINLKVLAVLFAALTGLVLMPAHAQHQNPELTDELRSLLLNTIADSDSFADRFDAEVWLVSMSSRLEPLVKDPEQRLFVLKLVHRYATLHQVPPELVLAVIEVESHFNRYAVSVAGAQGLMQVMPFWKNELGREEDNLIDVEINLQYGVTILKHYLDREKGRWPEALARYNGSYGSYRYSIKVMDAWENRWK